MDQEIVIQTPTVRPRLRLGPVRELFNTILFVVAVFVLMQLALPRSVVDGQSMHPTLETGDYLIVSRLNYLVVKPNHGDVIVFNSPRPLRENEPPLIKRVIGLPGDVVELTNQQVYLNGELLGEPYLGELCDTSHCRDNRWELGPEEYFMLGDNRNNSRDSRAFGPVPKENIIGQALFRYWPLDNIGLIDHHRHD